MHTRRCSDSSANTVQSNLIIYKEARDSDDGNSNGLKMERMYVIQRHIFVFGTQVVYFVLSWIVMPVSVRLRHGRVWQMESGLERHRINGAGHLSKSPHTNLLPLAAPGQIQTQIQIQIQINQADRLSKWPHTNILLLLLLHKFYPWFAPKVQFCTDIW